METLRLFLMGSIYTKRRIQNDARIFRNKGFLFWAEQEMLKSNTGIQLTLFEHADVMFPFQVVTPAHSD